ncbi:ATP-binding cassette domain-containing protein [Mangrovicoccus sp. HB182678]|uniref:ATP-binding cassette domain-containing protein n=1 Tax=Mangrovicoccus algicola TaxID=2771008 RepID=A0A8J6YY59_9RHOB|nr:ATP-binding cassette domain-containing protein [Mangrovicoccus algicola]
MIALEEVGKSFARRGGDVAALSQITFQVAPGEVLGIAGRSGAGKSTLLRLLSLQMRPDRGRLCVLGTRIGPDTGSAALRRLARQTGFVFQGFSLLRNLTVLDNVALPLKLRGADRATRREKARQLLDFVGLGRHALAWPATLSGGEAQRAAIARALIGDPRILYLDEPSSALDAATTRGILELLRDIRDQRGVTMILVAHQVDVLRYMCDRALQLEAGRIARIGPVARSAEFRGDRLAEMWGDDG